jgi:hypothetical protein
MKKVYSLFLMLFLLGFTSAEECSITNLASCISQSFFNFLLGLLNAPIQPILTLVYNLLTEPVNINLFLEIWSIIVYILSLFYGLILIYVGFKFMFAGHSPEEREKAKSSLAKTLIMISLVQASFYLYGLVIEVVSALSSVILNLLPQYFFLLTIDNITNMGLQFVFLGPYLIAVLVTLIHLVIRYMIVSFGVIFFSIGLFFYFIEPLNSYGRLIINFLFATISLTLFYSIIFLASSKLLAIPIFEHTKILVMIGAFNIANSLTLIAVLFIIIKSAISIASPVSKVTKVVGMVGG